MCSDQLQSRCKAQVAVANCTIVGSLRLHRVASHTAVGSSTQGTCPECCFLEELEVRLLVVSWACVSGELDSIDSIRGNTRQVALSMVVSSRSKETDHH